MLARITILALLTAIMSCKSEEKFEDLGTRVYGPVDVEVSADGQYFYVLNTDFDRTFGEGSILVIDSNGEKIRSISTPRLGRSITVSGSRMLVTFDKAEDESEYEVQLYDLADAADPQHMKTWKGGDLDCRPLNTAMRDGYAHFVVSCSDGKLFIGTFADNLADSTMRKVREYGYSRRAIYIDPNRELAFLFPTDVRSQTTSDALLTDEKSYDEITGEITNEPNEIPDDQEDTKFQRRNSSQRRRYKFVVYDIGSERAQSDEIGAFPLRLSGDSDEDEDAAIVDSEQRFLYFTLTDFDGTPDTDAGFTDLSKKHYRTNFWMARPDPVDPNSFYLSHRGKKSKKNSFANNIVRVSLIGDVTQSPVPATSEILSFERVYGFTGELNENDHFPGDFVVKNINGRQTLVVNHFKDLVTFRGSAHFSIAAKLLDGGYWGSEIDSSSSSNSYFEVAVNENGRALTCSYYGQSVIPLELDPGADVSQGGEGIKVGWGDIDKIQ